ncbi:MAG: type II secretion system F family protein [Firmicutes bacterium]|nr:type II secretion system F family protein [Bacillota bacterium]
MPTFEYKVKNKEGKLQKGKMAVLDREKLVEKLQKSGYTIIEIREIEETRKPAQEKGKKSAPLIDFGVPDDELAFFTRQLATILNAGVSLDRIISILYNQSKSPRLKNAIYEVGADLQKGTSFAEGLRKHKGVFDEMFISMVSVGETGGTLPQAINRMADIIEKNLSIKKKIKSAMVYPTFILIFSTLLCYVLLVKFVPLFKPLFDGFNLNLQQDFPITYVLLNLSDIVAKPAVLWTVLLLLVGLFIFYMIIRKLYAFRLFVDGLMLNVPVLNNLVKMAAFSRFCRGFASLTNSGVPMMKAMELVSDASGNLVIGQVIERMAKMVREGSSLSKAMKEEKLFPDIVIHMTNIGEESGSLPDMLDKTADYFDQNLDNAVAAFTSIIEPAMMVFVGLIVGLFVIGVILPVLSITSKMRM